MARRRRRSAVLLSSSEEDDDDDDLDKLTREGDDAGSGLGESAERDEGSGTQRRGLEGEDLDLLQLEAERILSRGGEAGAGRRSRSGRISARQAAQDERRESLRRATTGAGPAQCTRWSEDDSSEDCDRSDSLHELPKRAERRSATNAAQSDSEEEASWDGALIGRQMEDVHSSLPDAWEPLLKGDVFVDTVALERLLGGHDWMKSCPEELGPLGLVLDRWEALKHDLFPTAALWKARLVKHGSRYRNWDSSDFTVRMMTQKWLRTVKDDLGGVYGDLAGFWGNGSRGNKLAVTSIPVQEYNRLQRSVARRGLGEASALIAALQTSDESESDEEM